MARQNTDLLLDETASYVANNLLPYLTVGTGTAALNSSSTDITSAVQIGSSDRNKAPESISVVDNSFVLTFKLTSMEPDSQPVNISEVGIQGDGNTVDTDDELKSYYVFDASTKDNASQWTIRYSGRVVEDE